MNLYLYDRLRDHATQLLIDTAMVRHDAITLIQPKPSIPADLAFPAFAVAKAANAGNPAIAGDTVDPDGTGIPNLLKYAFNTDAPGAGRSRLPNTTAERDSADNKVYFTLIYSRRIGSTELDYTVEVSDNLASWDGTGAQFEQIGSPSPNTDGVTEQVKVRVKTPVANLSRKFLRVSAARN